MLPYLKAARWCVSCSPALAHIPTVWSRTARCWAAVSGPVSRPHSKEPAACTPLALLVALDSHRYGVGVGVTGIAVKSCVLSFVTFVKVLLEGSKVQCPGLPLEGVIVPDQPEGTLKE